MDQIPSYWQSSLEAVERMLFAVQRGRIVKSIKSAGGRPVQLLLYGEKNELYRTANLSSALGALDKNCYADKTRPDYKPTLLLVGCVHGGEFEGTVALLNLISMLEAGVDLKGEKNEFLSNITDKINLLIIPCLNPDGRSRIKQDSVVGMDYEEFRYYNQGTWKDGSLCGYPECKKIHPIKDYCKFLGAYFNDDGVNLMHDNFFGKKANETQFLFDLADEYVPDLTVLLHGGTNTLKTILSPTYAPDDIRKQIYLLEQSMKKRCDEKNQSYFVQPLDRGENKEPHPSFNLVSALYHYIGEPCVTFESNQGLSGCKSKASTYEEIYEAHMMLFEEAVKFILNKCNGKR